MNIEENTFAVVKCREPHNGFSNNVSELEMLELIYQSLGVKLCTVIFG